MFLHGNPTSSYIWRNVIPSVADLGRCLAPDLVGMGQSGRPPAGGLRFLDHARYLDVWFDELALDQRVVPVLHDWGSALGFHWARRHPDRVQAIAYMEAIVEPRRWVDFPHGRDRLFRALRSSEGERLIFDENYFIETILPKSVLRSLTDAEMEAYRTPFRDRASRGPMLAFPRELPIDGEPADVVDIVQQYAAWMAVNDIPKLLVAADPGALLTGRSLEFCRRWRNQTEVTVRGIHYVQEDSPDEIGRALAGFVQGVRGLAAAAVR